MPDDKIEKKKKNETEKKSLKYFMCYLNLGEIETKNYENFF